MATDKLNHALSYTNYGMLVFPCHHIEADQQCSCGKLQCPSAGKHPRNKGWQAEATLEEDLIRQFWGDEPLANVGVACGKDSNLTVLEVDGDLGLDTLRAL
jgi:putative DNA primase/helicase